MTPSFLAIPAVSCVLIEAQDGLTLRISCTPFVSMVVSVHRRNNIRDVLIHCIPPLEILTRCAQG